MIFALPRNSTGCVLLRALPWLAGCGVVRFYTLSSDSMSPTARSGDRVMVVETADAREHLHDGDIIAVKHGGYVVLKRIAAMPGESVEGRDWIVFRNGSALKEPYVAVPSTP